MIIFTLVNTVVLFSWPQSSTCYGHMYYDNLYNSKAQSLHLSPSIAFGMAWLLRCTHVWIYLPLHSQHAHTPSPGLYPHCESVNLFPSIRLLHTLVLINPYPLCLVHVYQDTWKILYCMIHCNRVAFAWYFDLLESLLKIFSRCFPMIPDQSLW